MFSSWQEREADCREDRSCFSLLIQKGIWFSGWGKQKVSHKPHRCLAEGNPPITFTACLGLCLLVIPQKRREVRRLRNGIPSALAWELCHTLQLLCQREKKEEYITEDGKSHTFAPGNRPRASELYLCQEPLGHSNLQHFLVHQICKCYWFIYMALYKQSSYYAPRKAIAKRFSEDKQLKETMKETMGDEFTFSK